MRKTIQDGTNKLAELHLYSVASAIQECLDECRSEEDLQSLYNESHLTWGDK